MKPFSKRLNGFVNDWFDKNQDKFTVYQESQFTFGDAENTFKLFAKHYKDHSTVPMWYDDNEDNIFADTRVNAKFRAWHDYNHVILGCDFSLKGEIKTYSHQQSSLPIDWDYERKLMYCEIVKQAEHYSSGGGIIENQREFTKSYLNKISDEE